MSAELLIDATVRRHSIKRASRCCCAEMGADLAPRRRELVLVVTPPLKLDLSSHLLSTSTHSMERMSITTFAVTERLESRS